MALLVLRVIIFLCRSTGSCMVNLTQVDILCQSDSALVMWEVSLAGEYTATAEDSEGHRLNCSSSNTSCEISSLRCGQLYTFSVMGPHCEVHPSNRLKKYSGETPEDRFALGLECNQLF